MQKQQQQQQNLSAQGNRQPRFNRQQPHYPQSSTADWDQKAAVHQGLFSGLFKRGSPEELSARTGESSHHESIEQKSSNSSQGLLSGIFKMGSNENVTAPKQEDLIAGSKKDGPLSFLKFRSKGDEPDSVKKSDSDGHVVEQRSIVNLTNINSEVEKERTSFGIFDRFIPKQKKDDQITPISSSTESIDLRTFEHSKLQQNQPLSSSYSTGHLPYTSYSHQSFQHHVPMTTSYSTEQLHYWKQGQQPSAILSSQSTGPLQPWISGQQYPRVNDYQVQPLSLQHGTAPINSFEHHHLQESSSWHQQLNEYSESDVHAESPIYYTTGLEYRQPPDGASMLEAPLCWSTTEMDPSPYYVPSHQREEIIDYQGQDGFQQEKNSKVYDMSYKYERKEFSSSYYQNDSRKSWNSYDDLRDVCYQTGTEDGESWIDCNNALNLSVKKPNPRFNRWHSLNESSHYDLQSVASYESLGCVSYHEDYFEENVPWNDTSLKGDFNYTGTPEFLNKCPFEEAPIDLSYSISDERNPWSYQDSNCPIDMEEEYRFLEEAEWYQQWLSLLEQGMWWPSEDGDYGYFIYTDGEFIYSLLTDGAGQNVYVCTPEEEAWVYGMYSDNLPSAWLENEMVAVCGFKIPLYNEDELFWFPGEDQQQTELLSAPLDLSAAFRKGDQIMNMNLEIFSQMFEDSIYYQREEPMDFSTYRLHKVGMDLQEQHRSRYTYAEPQIEAFDLTVKKGSVTKRMEGFKELFSQKVSVTLSSASPSESTSSGLFGLFRSHSKEPEHLEAKDRHFVQKPGTEEQSQPIQKISSFFSALGDLVGKTPDSDTSKTSTASIAPATTSVSATSKTIPNQSKDGALSLTSNSRCREESKPEGHDLPPMDQHSRNILSSGFQSLKSKIMKEETPTPTSVPQQVDRQATKPATTTSRTLPSLPTTAIVSVFGISSGQSEPPVSPSEKPKPVQSNLASQTPKPSQPNQASTEAANQDSFFKNPLRIFNISDAAPQDKQAEKPQGSGFLGFFKAAVGVEETKPEPPKPPQTQAKPLEKNAASSETINKENMGMSSLFGSIGDFFKVEPPPTKQQPPKQPLTQQEPEGDQQGSNIIKNDMNQDIMGPVPQQHTQEGLNEVTGDASRSSSRPKGLRKQQTLGGIGEARQPDVGSMPPFGQPQGPARSMSQNFPPNASLSKPPERSQTMPTGTPRPPPARQSNQGPPPKQTGGLFGFSIGDMLSGTSAPKQETPGKSLFSLFSGPSPQPAPSQTSSAHATPTASKPLAGESEGLFKMPSFFSLGGAPEENKPKASGSTFSLFNLSFMDEKKPEVPAAQSEKPLSHVSSKPYSNESKASTKDELDFMNSVLGLGTPRPKHTEARNRNEQDYVSSEQPASSLNKNIEVQSECMVYEDTKSVVPSSENEFITQSQDSLVEEISPALIPEITGFEVVEAYELQSDTIHLQEDTIVSHADGQPDGFCQVGEPVCQASSVEGELHLDACPPVVDKAFPQPPEQLPQTVQPQPRPVEQRPPGFPTGPVIDGVPKISEPEKTVLDSSVEMFSGFMSKVKLFSGGPSAPSKPSSGFFSTAQPSMFRSSPGPAPQQQQKSYFFNLPGSHQTESLKNELFGIFKMPGDKPAEEAKIPESKPTAALIHQAGVQDIDVKATAKELAEEGVLHDLLTEEPQSLVESEAVICGTMTTIEGTHLQEFTEIEPVLETLQEEESSLDTEILPATLAAEDIIITAGDVKPLVEVTVQHMEAEETSLCVVTSEECQSAEELKVNVEDLSSCREGEVTHTVTTVITGDFEDKGGNQESVPHETSPKMPMAEPPPGKSLFDIPGLSTPKFGFMSSSDSGKTFGSFFSPPSIPKVMPQKEGGLLSGFKNFSAGLFQEDKPTVKEDPSATSMFGKKQDFAFPWQKESPELSKQQPAVITFQPTAKDNKLVGANGAISGTQVNKSTIVSDKEMAESHEISSEVKELHSLDQTVHTSRENAEPLEEGLDATGKEPVSDSSATPQVEILTPDLDQSRPLAENGKASLSEPLPSAELTLGALHDDLPKRDLLNVTRPVAA
ncbi:microtubule-associated protein futsch-like [Amia ocellicauda]|uniref:microtubule-associated protein futsch-like n=1 Tax=Amia ocellicauda TaxID=2972642 RepID=UPI0034648FB9